ncbi:MAG: LytTR family DNA-binding domain-containing protein [Coriobacteriales bacterium]|jgi:two-component system response regulator LytT
MLKAMVVDDEAPARSELKYLLDEVGGVEVVAEADNIRDAILELKSMHCDVIFLDINMPGVNGMQFAEALTKFKNLPAVVFVTAYGDYATSAFDVNAVDYLVKPVETDRLRQAIEKVKNSLGMNSSKSTGERIPVEKGGKKVLVPVDKIRYVMAKDDYSCLYTEDDHYLSTISLTQLETRLGSDSFFRVHRRYIVNLSYVSEVESVPGGTLLLTMRDTGEQIPVSRRRVAPLKKVLKL